ncbi:MAG: holo-ACP synthase [Gemmatimonadaceae bacterium]|nr:holo-ACP synthase [Gemmatimonadaceae bacterium]
MPLRVGLDLVEIARLRRLLQAHPPLAARTFSERELAAVQDANEFRRYAYLAGRFATKEAVLKALGTGLSAGIPLGDIETTTADSGAPVLELSGEALRRASEAGFTTFETSISHDGGIAGAVVVLT